MTSAVHFARCFVAVFVSLHTFSEKFSYLVLLRGQLYFSIEYVIINYGYRGIHARCYCHNMFRSYDHHQVTYSSILSQAVCLTAIAVALAEP
jgi:hypothetical protein